MLRYTTIFDTAKGREWLLKVDLLACIISILPEKYRHFITDYIRKNNINPIKFFRQVIINGVDELQYELDEQQHRKGER